MKVLGITGPIGSGKSTVAELLIALGLPCYDCDRAAKELMTKDAELREQIVDLFGDQAYTKGGELNRGVISARIFSDIQLRRQLERVIHPAVARDFERWVQLQTSEWVGLESAILVESGFVSLADRVLFVTASSEVRLQRVSLRDGADRKAILERMAAQNSSPDIVGLIVDTILNDSRELLREKVVAFYEKLTNFAPT